jgi:hypothetical protein
MSLTIKRNSPSVSQRTKPGQREREKELYEETKD